MKSGLRSFAKGTTHLVRSHFALVAFLIVAIDATFQYHFFISVFDTSRTTYQIRNRYMTEQEKHKAKPNANELLADPTRVTVSVSQASMILGIAKSTAHSAYKQTGFLMAGVPVLRIGKRCVVSVSHLRSALGYPEPIN